jgi:DNA-binding transcriptional regulator PaaX
MDIEINAPLVRSVTVEKMTGLCRVQLHRLVRKGRLSRVREDGKTYYSMSQVIDLMAQNKLS